MAPTAVDTSVLDQFRRQFYQWYLIDNRSRSEVAKSFHHLFQRITETTKLKIIVSDEQWRGRLQRWQATWDARKSKESTQFSLPNDLKHLPLWYERDQPCIPFHACTPEQCNSCVSSRRQAGIGHHLNTAVMPGHHQCPTCGTTCSVCANSMSVAPPEMMRSYSGPPMTAPYATVPNVVDTWSSVQGSFGHPYLPHLQTYPLNANYQGHPTSLPQYDFAAGNQGALLPYRTTAPILGSSETSVELRRATPISHKRSRRNSPEPNRVVEAPVE